MSVIHGNQNEFENLVASGVTLVDFFATWCGPCKMLSPVLEELASLRDSVSIVKIDIDENQALAQKYGIMSVPTLMLFENGKPIDTKVGFLPKPQLEAWINDHK